MIAMTTNIPMVCNEYHFGCTQVATGTADVKAHTNEWQQKYRDQQKCTENSPYFTILYYHVFVVRTAKKHTILLLVKNHDLTL
jgi:hypothetical protein